MLGDNQYSSNKEINDLVKYHIKYESFEWPRGEYKERINEKDATPFIVERIKSVMNLVDLYNENTKYQILDVSADPTLNLDIPVDKYSIFTGRPDAIIYHKRVADYSRIHTLRVMFEFKTKDTIFQKTAQPMLEILAACINAWHPVLLVVTDLEDFRMIVCRRDRIYEARFNDMKLAFEFITYWLYHKCDQNTHSKNYINDMESHLKEFNIVLKNAKFIAGEIEKLQDAHNINVINYNDNLDKMFTPNGHEINNGFNITVNIIENAYFNTRRIIGIESRSGRVYKISSQNKDYALKLYCHDNVEVDILEEMKNEKKIYEKLNINGKSIYWPTMVYAGNLFNSAYYGILTNFIEGNCYTSINKRLFKGHIRNSCIKALKELHNYDIIHGDIRFANFIIKKDNSAVIIDFGFSKISNDNNKKEHEMNLLIGNFT